MTRPIGISVPHRRVDDDDDIQDYKKPWVGLTDDEIWESDSYKIAITDQETRWLYRFAKDIEAKLKEKNT